MAKISITAEGMENLLNHARKNGTLNQWADLAMEWIRAADKAFAEIKETADNPSTEITYGKD